MGLAWLMIAGVIALVGLILIIVIYVGGSAISLAIAGVIRLLGWLVAGVIRLAGWIIYGCRRLIDRIRDARL
jgi:hypothetical protein